MSQDEGRVVVEILLSGGSLVVGAHAGGKSAFSWGPSAKTERLIRSFRDEISLAEAVADASRNPDNIASMRRVTDGLYDEVIRPVEKVFQGRDRILVMASGPISAVPIEALTRRGRPMSVDYTFEYGAAMGRATMPRIRGARRRTRSVAAASRIVVLGNIDDLPAAEIEASLISEASGAEILEGRKIGKDGFLDAVGDAEDIHFIGHAVSRSVNPFLSYLDLGDGERLFSREIARARLPRRPFVQISACSAAAEGGGVGTATAFLLAGASAVLATLWRIKDSSALFSALISRGIIPPPDITSLHPFEWAGVRRIVPVNPLIS